MCGQSFPDCVYDFHHINPDEKDFQLSSGSTRGLKACKEEVDKCLLLCANCHRIVHNT